MTQIIIDKDARDNGLANMIKDLLTQNIASHPQRAKDANALNGNIIIDAKDIDVSLTLVCGKGKIQIRDGSIEPYRLKITTASDNIMKLNMLKIKWGLPYYFDKAGREVLAMLFNGKLKVNGLVAHPVMLTRITKLFSVM